MRYANEAFSRLSGGGVESLLGRPFVEAVPPSCAERAIELLDRVYQTGEPAPPEDLGGVAVERGDVLWRLSAWPTAEDEEPERTLLIVLSDGTLQEQARRRDRELAEETRTVNERLVVAGLRMQELAEEAERARRRLFLVAEAGRMLGAALDTSSILPAVAELLVPAFGDCCAINVTRGPGAISRSVAAPDPPGGRPSHAIEQMRRRMMARGEALACTSTPDDGESPPEIAAILRGAGFSSAISVPLHSRGSARGALTILARDRRYEPADVTLACEIADRIAIGIDRAELYQEALRAVRVREDMLATVSHDLRNPLNAVFLSAALLAKDASGKSSHVERIQRSAEHMRSLIQDLVDSTKIDAGRFLVERQPHALGAVVTSVVDMLTPVAARKSLRIEATIEAELAELPVWIDRERIMQVLTNLLGNAIKFTPEGGAVTASVARAEGEVRLAIRDTGPGIPREDLDRLFERFWQARQTARLGMGLGLFIAKEIVVAHGGRIWVESELGAGSVFFVSLPLAPPPA